MSTIVAHVELGELREQKLVESSVEDAVRNLLFEVLNLWDPRRSDLVVTRERLLDIKPELAEYGDVDVYVVSYDIEWRDDSVVDKRFFIVMKNLGEVSTEVISELVNLSRVALLEFEKEVKSI
ncbi:MAG: DUF2286 domain-containing protein [Sulfolobales archaeon]